MCGLAGFWSSSLLMKHLDVTARCMADTLSHRGPDDAGVWTDKSIGIALAHRRLAIQDLSPAGHQPMISDSGRYVIVFNGEIYNHLHLRTELEKNCSGGLFWKGESDTETLLAAFEVWGLEKTIKKTVGMFSIALWDRVERTLTLVRDRMGEKPLYYGWVHDTLVFGSELKAIRAFPGFDNNIERCALSVYMRHNYIPAPWSVYENIWKLPQGCFVQFQQANPALGRGDIKCYWSLQEVAKRGITDPFDGSETEAIDELERLLRQSISGQMMADVPLGAFLSGGVDSSTIVALMQAMSDRPVKTFTIGFHEDDYNEAHHAKAVAEYLGSNHTEWYLTHQDALDVIPKLPGLYDEPFADSSQIPTYLVSMLARQHVTVSLSGDGGDELFGGYDHYAKAKNLLQRLSMMPLFLRRLAASGVRGISPAGWDEIFKILHPFISKRFHDWLSGYKLHKGADLIVTEWPEEFYLRFISYWGNPAEIVQGVVTEPQTLLTDPSKWLNCQNFEHRMMYLDAITYLPDDILVKVDRAAMGVSLETRAPVLDHRVVEFAWRIPLAMKLRDGQGKWLLRQVLYRNVPSTLIERPKMGFGVPIEHWLRGPLKEWADDLLSEQRLKQEGFFKPEVVRTCWIEHLSGKRNWASRLWGVLMFQAWIDEL